MTEVKVAITQWAKDGPILEKIRREVFVEEQNVPEALELDEFDDSAVHFIARDENQEAVGTGRLVIKDNHGRIGRLAVRKPWRQKGIGGLILTEAKNVAEKEGIEDIVLGAQVSALSFYEGHGFRPFGLTFMDAGIEHIEVSNAPPLNRVNMVPRPQLNYPLTLGQTDRPVRFFLPDDCLALAARMAEQATRSFCIMSNQLDARIFDDEGLCTQLLHLAKKHRNTEIRILVKDTRDLAHKGHRLVSLAQRVPSKIHLRTMGADATAENHELMLADGAGLILRPDCYDPSGFANFNSAGENRKYQETFDQHWRLGVEDKNLQQKTL